MNSKRKSALICICGLSFASAFLLPRRLLSGRTSQYGYNLAETLEITPGPLEHHDVYLLKLHTFVFDPLYGMRSHVLFARSTVEGCFECLKEYALKADYVECKPSLFYNSERYFKIVGLNFSDTQVSTQLWSLPLKDNSLN